MHIKFRKNCDKIMYHVKQNPMFFFLTIAKNYKVLSKFYNK